MTEFGKWDTESLRLSVFHPERPSQAGLWKQVVEIEPESSDTRAREGIVQEQGIVDGNVLLLVSQSNRLDWHLLPGPPQNNARRGPPALVDAGQCMLLLKRAMDVSVRARVVVNRLALGVVCIRQAPDLREGLNQLSEYLPRLDLANAGGQDFAYQINRPRRSPHVSHISINRLSRWQLEEIQSGALTINPSGRPSLGMSEGILVSKLILDINTAVSNSAFSADKVPDLFDDLADFAKEIAIQGDIP